MRPLGAILLLAAWLLVVYAAFMAAWVSWAWADCPTDGVSIGPDPSCSDPRSWVIATVTAIVGIGVPVLAVRARRRGVRTDGQETHAL